MVIVKVIVVVDNNRIYNRNKCRVSHGLWNGYKVNVLKK